MAIMYQYLNPYSKLHEFAPASSDVQKWQRYLRNILLSKGDRDLLKFARLGVNLSHDLQALPALATNVPRLSYSPSDELLVTCAAAQIAKSASQSPLEEQTNWQNFIAALPSNFEFTGRRS